MSFDLKRARRRKMTVEIRLDGIEVMIESMRSDSIAMRFNDSVMQMNYCDAMELARRLMTVAKFVRDDIANLV